MWHQSWHPLMCFHLWFSSSKKSLASSRLKIKWSLCLVEGVFVCGMPCGVNEMGSPSSGKSVCGSKPKSRKGRLNVGWNNEAIGDEKGIILG